LEQKADRKISIVIPIYCEDKNIKELYVRLKHVTQSIEGYTWEYIFVNDGSSDNSFSILKQMADLDKKIKVVNFSRNFGKEIALSAGVQHAAGQAVITIDADLQHPPELIPELIRKWEEGLDVVVTIRKKINGQPLMRKIGSNVFYWLMARVSETEMVAQTTDFRLLDRKVVDIFKEMTERSRIYRGIIDWIGFKRGYVEFEADARVGGKVGYSYKKLLALAINSITTLSLLPLKIAGWMGILITSVSGLLFMIMFLTRFLFGRQIFTPLAIVVVANTLLIGIVLMCLGLIALYIANIHNEVINRPLYIIKDKLNLD
jgi:polyisoprenyl-phosphate glycosyltransferase